MRRRYSHTQLDVRRDDSEDINPMEGVANLVDAMLVLACGLMLALVINWNVDIGSAGTTVEMDQKQEVQQIDGVSANGESVNSGSGYEELGMVYRDPKTGKLYMVEQTGTDSGNASEQGADGSAADSSGTAADAGTDQGTSGGTSDTASGGGE